MLNIYVNGLSGKMGSSILNHRSARPSLSSRSPFGRLLRSARPSLSFRSLFGRLLRLHGPRYLFALFSDLLGPSWVSCCCSWPLLGLSCEALGRFGAALGPLLAALGRSWEPLGRLLISKNKNENKHNNENKQTSQLNQQHKPQFFRPKYFSFIFFTNYI